MDEFDGKVFVVTGAGAGIGETVTETLFRRGARVPLADASESEWDDVIATDLTGVFFCLQHELPAIVANGGGAIVNMSSANGIVGVPAAPAYTAAKHGILGLTRTAALDYAAQGVRVNAVGPGYVATPRLVQMPADSLDALARSHPLGRLATREDVAKLVAFLLSDRARLCTGGFHVVDGGYTAA